MKGGEIRAKLREYVQLGIEGKIGDDCKRGKCDMSKSNLSLIFKFIVARKEAGDTQVLIEHVQRAPTNQYYFLNLGYRRAEMYQARAFVDTLNKGRKGISRTLSYQNPAKKYLATTNAIDDRPTSTTMLQRLLRIGGLTSSQPIAPPEVTEENSDDLGKFLVGSIVK